MPGVTIAALSIAVGLLALLARLTSWDPDASVFIATALLVVGLGLVVAAYSDGPTAKGGLVILGIVLSFSLLASLNAPWDEVSGGVGNRTWAPATAEDVRPVYDAGMGDVELDLSRIDVGDLDGPVRTRVDAGVGNLEVLLPRDADVQIEVDAGIGNVDVLDDESADRGVYPGEGTGSWVDDGDPEIVLTIDAGLGNLEVSRG